MAQIKLTDLPKRDNALLIWQKINKKNGKDNNFDLFPTTTPPTEVRLKFNPDVKGIDKLFKTQDIEDITALSKAKIIAVTGSSGKTTVKTLLGKMLKIFGDTCYSPKSFNKWKYFSSY